MEIAWDHNNSFGEIMVMRSDRPSEFIFYVQSVYRYHLWPYNDGLNKSAK